MLIAQPDTMATENMMTSLIKLSRIVVVNKRKGHLKGKYHANLLSFQNPKMFVCQQKKTK